VEVATRRTRPRSHARPYLGGSAESIGALHVSTEPDKAVVRRFFEQAINQRHYDVIDEVVASDFVLHSALLGEVHGGDAYKQSVLGLLNPCPDFHATVEDWLFDWFRRR
jgi:hypothetical protein